MSLQQYVTGEPALDLSEECEIEIECPKRCRCDKSVIDCSGQGFTSVPENLPSSTAEL